MDWSIILFFVLGALALGLVLLLVLIILMFLVAMVADKDLQDDLDSSSEHHGGF